MSEYEVNKLVKWIIGVILLLITNAFYFGYKTSEIVSSIENIEKITNVNQIYLLKRLDFQDKRVDRLEDRLERIEDK